MSRPEPPPDSALPSAARLGPGGWARVERRALRSLLVGLILPFLCLSLPGCKSRQAPEPALRRIERPMMGTLVEVAWAPAGLEGEADRVRSVLDRMEALAARLNLFDPGSEVSALNHAAGKGSVKVSGELLEVVELALRVSRLTGGAFDITIGSAERAWGDIEREGGGRVPSPEGLAEGLRGVGYQRVRVDLEAGTIRLARPGMRVDLGGIAKGFVVDKGTAWLRSAGIRRCLVNAGGDIRVTGGGRDRPWRVGIRDPFRRGGLLGVLRVREGAVVTSGTYERYLETREGRFPHILDPRTGLPVRGPVSVTVVGPEAALADALATALMVKGRRGGIELLGRLEGVKALFVEGDRTVWAEEDLGKILELRSPWARDKVRFFPCGALPGTRRDAGPSPFPVERGGGRSSTGPG